jgi:hypothetical protein
MLLPLPTRLHKTTVTKAIDGTPLVYTVIDEEMVPALSNSKKVFALHYVRLGDGREEIRIGYYMIAHKKRMRGKWAWGQFAPFMTKEEMALIFSRAKAKGWI